MKFFRSILIAILSVVVLASCEKDEDIYFVKYEIITSLNEEEELVVEYTANDENSLNHYRVKSDNTFSVTIGPVAKGFHTRITASIINRQLDLEAGGLYCWIYVSKNNGPFGLVKQVGSRYCTSTGLVEYIVGE